MGARRENMFRSTNLRQLELIEKQFINTSTTHHGEKLAPSLISGVQS